MKIAIMQPYLFPYIGYFQLIHSVDKFVFYDDVAYIKQGWVNRNCLCVGGERRYFTLPVTGVRTNTLISEVNVVPGSGRKVLRSIKEHYRKAPYFDSFFPVVEKILGMDATGISAINCASVVSCMEYIGLNRPVVLSSETYPESRGIGRVERLFSILKREGASVYVNAPGGRELYDPVDFKKSGFDLYFIEPSFMEYSRPSPFLGGLSIIDVLMHVSPEEALAMCSNYLLKNE